MLPLAAFVTACDGVDDQDGGEELMLDDDLELAAPAEAETGAAGELDGPVEDLRAVGAPPLPLVGGGFVWGSWGTTSDTLGLDMGSQSTRTCFLSGVAGNLNVGARDGFAGGRPSVAWVYDFPGVPHHNDDHYYLVAHGGAYRNQTNDLVWQNNPVNAQATCLYTTSDRQYDFWESGDGPVKIADLNSSTVVGPRHCYLSGIEGVGGAWNSSTRYARVVRRTTTDASHPTTGWYIEANLPATANGDRARVHAQCITFPSTTSFTSNTLTAGVGATNSEVLTSGSAVKACALTGISGALNVDDWADGAVMTFPATQTGNWTLTVKNGKSASWECAQ
ncbi:hypothetical protein [Nannocystis exedens]|uniref:hypothetical protein n=1 Tax=Nannocystis exedens TaxID=54 RepID=UPI000BBA0363|nr:hypothetical protein [Nannocystis exedens]